MIQWIWSSEWSVKWWSVDTSMTKCCCKHGEARQSELRCKQRRDGSEGEAKMWALCILWSVVVYVVSVQCSEGEAIAVMLAVFYQVKPCTNEAWWVKNVYKDGMEHGVELSMQYAIEMKYWSAWTMWSWCYVMETMCSSEGMEVKLKACAVAVDMLCRGFVCGNMASIDTWGMG